MVASPELVFLSGYRLCPADKSVLSPLLVAYHENPQAARTALPWLVEDEDIQGQFSDMLFDIESAAQADRLHFWAIKNPQGEFVGMLGLGDELQLVHSNYNLGYWVRDEFQRQGIANAAVDAVFEWLKQRDDHYRVEISVHPHNQAGLAAARSIIKRWNGEEMDGFVGIDFQNRTVPHSIFIVDLN